MASCNEFILLAPVAVTTSPPNNSEYPASLEDALSLNRSSFPDDFIFGTASAAYQVRTTQ